MRASARSSAEFIDYIVGDGSAIADRDQVDVFTKLLIWTVGAVSLMKSIRSPNFLLRKVKQVGDEMAPLNLLVSEAELEATDRWSSLFGREWYVTGLCRCTRRVLRQRTGHRFWRN